MALVEINEPYRESIEGFAPAIRDGENISDYPGILTFGGMVTTKVGRRFFPGAVCENSIHGVRKPEGLWTGSRP